MMTVTFGDGNVCEIELQGARHEVNIQHIDMGAHDVKVRAVFIRDSRISITFPLEYLIIDGTKIDDH